MAPRWPEHLKGTGKINPTRPRAGCQRSVREECPRHQSHFVVLLSVPDEPDAGSSRDLRRLHRPEYRLRRPGQVEWWRMAPERASHLLAFFDPRSWHAAAVVPWRDPGAAVVSRPSPRPTHGTMSPLPPDPNSLRSSHRRHCLWCQTRSVHLIDAAASDPKLVLSLDAAQCDAFLQQERLNKVLSYEYTYALLNIQTRSASCACLCPGYAPIGAASVRGHHPAVPSFTHDIW
jgi:hypothetical protein